MLKKRIAVLVSGGGTNLQALIDAEASGRLRSGTVALVVSDRPSAYALTRARHAGVRTAVIPRAAQDGRDGFEARLEALLEEHRIDVIVLAGFLCILSGAFTAKWPERIINIHPSLIPAFCGEGFYGLRVHRAVLDAGVSETGATVHIVNEIPDGGRILMQKRVRVLPGDTPESLQARVMREAEHVLLPEAAEMLCAGLIMDKGGDPMHVSSIAALLGGNRYPGRGVALGLAPDGKTAAAAYFIMGRSTNSRNRVFFSDGDSLRIRIHDAAKLEDPSLILYTPLRMQHSALIVSNGDQTDTICDGLKKGLSFEDALESRRFEPDAPNYTARISGLMLMRPDFSYRLSILKAGDPEGKTCSRQSFRYEPLPGFGHLVHTYDGDGAPLPAFTGEPKPFAVPESIDDFAPSLWDSLDHENRVALYVRYTAIDTGVYTDRLFNSIDTGEEA